MVIAYKISPFSAWLLKRMIKVQYVNLINILAEKEIIPECLQEKCDADILAEHLWRIFSNESLRLEQVEETQNILKRLQSDPSKAPSEVAAQTVLKILKSA